MVNILWHCAIIAFSASYIIDISGAVGKLNKAVFKRLYGNHLQYNGWYIPVLGCSRCATFWAVLIYCLIISGYNIIYSVGIASVFSYINPIITLSMQKLIVWLSDCLTE